MLWDNRDLIEKAFSTIVIHTFFQGDSGIGIVPACYEVVLEDLISPIPQSH